MKTFFEKFPLEFKEMTAVKMIHKTIEKAQHCLKKSKKDKKDEYIKYLMKAYWQLCYFFDEKGLNPQDYKE